MKTFGNIIIVITLILLGMLIGLFVAVTIISNFMVTEGAAQLDYGRSSLTVVSDNRVQPFGPSAEDEYTATYALQDTDYLQVTLNKVFIGQ